MNPKCEDLCGVRRKETGEPNKSRMFAKGSGQGRGFKFQMFSHKGLQSNRAILVLAVLDCSSRKPVRGVLYKSTL